MNYSELLEFVNRLPFYCTDRDAWECMGDCSKCNCHTVTEREVMETLERYYGKKEK